MGQKLDVTITYLELTSRVEPKPFQLPHAKIAILRAHTPPVHYYRYLYSAVGDPHKWVSRKRLADHELKIILDDPDVHIYILYLDGVPAGFCELDGRSPSIVELRFFGLAPDFQGRGLGRYFLGQCIDLAWQLNPEKIRLETCTLDHPAALPLYQKLGFTVFQRSRGQVELIDE